ncbi:hypothetical protein B0A81_09860 [Flavobacterium plurextorum]|uniref:HTH araC/xylS-type domain-containing protein n=1 Tax=Flavobacterium plurextorum TaxID=1114867 RepID=A0ABX4CV38_9FLAO|nr:AraC family transcriptional regulator [Flavobacterium plurextorum]OXB08601.1 hypothetical protein B0A81_09860 [Flavobacterium plurextorum]
MWALFIGKFCDNVMHQHYALQISFASNESISIRDADNNQNTYTQCFINSNICHQFHSSEICLIILINPLSTIGHKLFRKYSQKLIVNLQEDFKDLSVFFKAYLNRQLAFEDFINHVSLSLKQFECRSEHDLLDDRIYGTLQYVEQHFDRIISLEEIAEFCNLSKSRFLHLFKENTGLNFRRYQLWIRLIKSLPYLKEHTITQTAHQFGFTDSPHYTRTFKETFGLLPKFFKMIK